MNQVCVNGKFLAIGQPTLAVDNKSYRYGDGVFETLKIFKGQILLESLHFDRFFKGLDTLGFVHPVHFTREHIRQLILLLVDKNRCGELARVRLTAYRGNGGIYDGEIDTHFTIESWPLTAAANKMNENGLDIGVYPDARKSTDLFSSLKSANYLPYVMAAHYAKKQKWNDALVLNTQARLADASIANFFIVRHGVIITPPLSEGCVAGVMRQYLLDRIEVIEQPLLPTDLLTADEIFLTNAISGIRWVKHCEGKDYGKKTSVEIFAEHIATFYR